MKPDFRPSLVCDDVNDLELFGWNAKAAGKDQAIVHLYDVRDALIHGCRCPRGASGFLRVEGKASQGIRLLANELYGAKKSIILAAGLSKNVGRVDALK